MLTFGFHTEFRFSAVSGAELLEEASCDRMDDNVTGNLRHLLSTVGRNRLSAIIIVHVCKIYGTCVKQVG